MLIASVVAAAGLKTQLDLTTLALGEPLTLTLAGGTLKQIDLAPLAVDFEARGRTLSRSGNEETLVLTLYPLRSGRLDLPALQAGAARSRPARVTVTAGSVDTPQVLFRVETDPAAPIQRQPTRLTLEACDDGSLDWKRPPLPLHAALYHRPLGEEQIDLERDGVRCTAHRWHWRVIPTQAGPLQLSLPMLEAGKFGRQLRFPAPAVAFTAAAVPAWLPLNVAIGLPHLTAEKQPETWPVQRPLAWRFEVVGGYSEEGLKTLLALLLHNQPGFNTYAPTLETLPGEDRNSPLTHLRVTIYADARETGPLRLPTLTLPWFDPVGGRLESLTLNGDEVNIVNPALATLARGFALLLAVGMTAALLVWMARRHAWRRHKRRRLAAVAASTDTEALLRAVRGFSLAARPRPAATLGVWRERLRAEARCEGLEALIDALERARYGGIADDFTALRARAIRVLAACRTLESSAGYRRAEAPGDGLP
ncbi:MAG: hypothetical protein Q8M09_13105 [Pseudomonadota bacterium]|nr:hypothetical protein [Pseudomonadota bacterium]MDP1905165.1 hypothetical protein [Pseudomonadota bacterium]MDP2351922.1 hypothetical protein [Pseudomonadota bacterium]